MKGYFLLLLLFLGIRVCGLGQVLENYDHSWRPYSSGNWWENNDQIQVKVNVRDFDQSYLRLQIPAQSTLFIDGKLWEYFKSDTLSWVPIADIRALTASDTATLLLINPRLSRGKVGLQKVISPEQVADEEAEGGSPDLLLGRQSAQSLKDFYVVALLINLVFFALYKIAYPYLLGVLIQPLSVINAEDFSDSGSLQKFFSPDILFYMLIVSMMLSQLGVAVLYTKSETFATWAAGEFGSLMMLWGLGILVIFAISVLKFLGVRVSGFFFDLGKNDFAHFFYLLRLIVFGTSVVLLVLAYYVINRYWELAQISGLMISGFFWFYLLGILGLFFIMMNRLSFKKYHLFTYLCIAELVPFLILSKWILVLLE